MKIIITVFLLLFLTPLVHSQKSIYIDEKGDTINKSTYLEKWRNKDFLLSAWQHKDKKGKHYLTLKKDLYLKGTYDYINVKSKIKELTNIKIPDSTTLLIEYFYKDDLCSSSRDNNWTRSEISERKKFTDPMRISLIKKQIFLISLFEPGIKLKNKPENKNEYFFTDKNNFFRKNFFINPTLCGSFVLMKNNGECIIRNGEYRADSMADHLKPENWSLFFEKKD